MGVQISSKSRSPRGGLEISEISVFDKCTVNASQVGPNPSAINLNHESKHFTTKASKTERANSAGDCGLLYTAVDLRVFEAR